MRVLNSTHTKQCCTPRYVFEVFNSFSSCDHLFSWVTFFWGSGLLGFPEKLLRGERKDGTTERSVQSAITSMGYPLLQKPGNTCVGRQINVPGSFSGTISDRGRMSAEEAKSLYNRAQDAGHVVSCSAQVGCRWCSLSSNRVCVCLIECVSQVIECVCVCGSPIESSVCVGVCVGVCVYLPHILHMFVYI